LKKNSKKIFNESIPDSNTILVISDASIKNNITTLISYICNGQNIIAKTIYYIMNVIFTEAELFFIRCGINQAIQVLNIKKIIIIIDTISAARYIFDLSAYSF